MGSFLAILSVAFTYNTLLQGKVFYGHSYMDCQFPFVKNLLLTVTPAPERT